MKCNKHNFEELSRGFRWADSEFSPTILRCKKCKKSFIISDRYGRIKEVEVVK